MELRENWGCEYVLLKGGHSCHLTSDENSVFKDSSLYERKADDILVGPHGFACKLSANFVDNANTHGTGCTLSSAIASRIALGDSTLSAGIIEIILLGLNFTLVALLDSLYKVFS